MNKQHQRVLAVAVLAGLGIGSVQAGFNEALTSGKYHFDSRIRYESVEQDNPVLDAATAMTWRTRIGYTSADLSGFSAMVEAEHVQAIGEEDFNSLVNGQTTFSTVADPESSEVNQAYLNFKADGFLVRYGRQRIVLDNQRFVGNVGWRQNEQTFDASVLQYTGVKNLTLTGAYVSNVNRVLGDAADNNAAAAQKGNLAVDAPILNIHYKIEGFGELTGYIYNLELLDFQNSSTSTQGLRWKGRVILGEIANLGYVVELAKQSDYGENALSFEHDYRNLELSYAYGDYAVKVGQEMLGAENNHAFQTPLATLHAFNGWVDMFLITPGNGLVDTSVSLNAKWGDMTLMLVLNDYESDTSGFSYGSETGVLFSHAFGKLYSAGVKLAQYRADDFAVDTDKVWVWGEVKF